ncbi:MAG: hypothetical protein ABS79_04310 [Planctomycetes bacterium SCN 63-9]|nr:MAG: hypothetical protein ABS79_04310 [Planctomycetes bacterium SCN 63-9]
MFARKISTCRSFALLAASGAMIVIAACGEDSDYGLGQRYPVSGTVTYNGKPLEKGQINFYSEDPKGVGANGTIENGSFTLSTVGDNDGARAGKYKVGVISKEDPAAQAKAEFEKAKAKSKYSMGNVQENVNIPPEFMSKASREAKSLIPAGYGDLRTTNLKAEVTAEGPNQFTFTLTDADAPPEPPKSTKGAKVKDVK